MFFHFGKVEWALSFFCNFHLYEVIIKESKVSVFELLNLEKVLHCTRN
jgi:hypothetical protein